MEAQLLLQIDADPEPALVTVARHRMIEALPASCRTRAEEAEIVVSELVSNAVEHARTCIEVRVLHVGPSEVRIEVDDDSEGWPMLREPGLLAENGRGLVIVDRLARCWGIERHTGDGKTMWAEVAC